MIGYILRRLAIMVPTLAAISIITFAIIQLPPGDYVTTMVAEMQAEGEGVDQTRIAFLRQQYGLDQPFIERYGSWIGGVLKGDFGYSFAYNMPVTNVVGDKLWLTALVSISTVIFTWAIAFPIGIYSATHRYSFGDQVLSFIGFLGLATPNFLLALVLLYAGQRLFGISFGGLIDARYVDQPWTFDKIASLAAHLVAPVVVIGAAGTAAMIRRLRANLLDELHKLYVTTARAKGLSEGRLLLRYPLRMALNPFISDIGNLLPQLVSGATIVSVVMSLPTTGPVLLDALLAQDMYLAGSFLMFLAVLTVVGVLLSDIALALLDPRIRFGASEAK